MLRFLLPLLSAALLLVGCDDGHLRGSVAPSADGKTYLVVADDNGGHCGAIKVDGKDWPYSIGQPSLIASGEHTIDCGGELSFTVPAGAVFTFDYWGP